MKRNSAPIGLLLQRVAEPLELEREAVERKQRRDDDRAAPGQAEGLAGERKLRQVALEGQGE